MTRLRWKPDATVVVSLINGIGDTLLALPAIRRLSASVSHQRHRLVLWAAHDVLEPVFHSVPATRCAVRVDRHVGDFFVDATADVRAAAARLHQAREVVWVSLNAYSPCWPADEALRRAVEPAHVLSFGDRPEAFRVDPSGHGVPMREQYLRVLGDPMPCLPQERRLELPEATRTAACTELHALGIQTPYVAIHTDSEDHKLWPRAAWRALIETLHAEGSSVVAVGHPEPGSLPVPVVVAGAWHVHAAVVAGARTFVGIDSCFAHVADVSQVSGVALFGQTDPIEWGCQGPEMRVLVAPDRNLNRLTPQAVAAQLRDAASEGTQYR